MWLKQSKESGEEEKSEKSEKFGGEIDAGLLCHFKDSGFDFLQRKMRSHQKFLHTRKMARRGGGIRLTLLKGTNLQQVVNKL